MDKEFTSDFFDDAITEWRKDKLPLEDGSFRYRCCFIYANNERCIKMTSIQNSLLCSPTNINTTKYCKTHIRTYNTSKSSAPTFHT